MTMESKRKKCIGHLVRNSTWVTSIIERKLERKLGRGILRQSYMKQYCCISEKYQIKNL